MSERWWRFVQGGFLLLIMSLGWELGMMIFIGLALFEGLTNWRVPKLVNAIVKGVSLSSQVDGSVSPSAHLPLEAEQVMRLAMAVMLFLSYFRFPDIAWFFPWFLGVMLLLAGISRICPMVMFFRFVGFR